MRYKQSVCIHFSNNTFYGKIIGKVKNTECYVVSFYLPGYYCFLSDPFGHPNRNVELEWGYFESDIIIAHKDMISKVGV